MAETECDTLIRQASRQMLCDRSPRKREDWMKVMNFVAWNLDFPNSLHVCHEIVHEYDVPLSEEEIKEIVDFQAFHRGTKQLSQREKIAALLSDAAIHEADAYLGAGTDNS